MLLRKHAIKISSHGNNPTKDSIVDHWSYHTANGLENNTYSILAPIEKDMRDVPKIWTSNTPPWHDHKPEIDTTLVNVQDKTKHSIEYMRSLTLEHLAKYQDHRRIYVDGSSKDGRTACAFVADGVANELVFSIRSSWLTTMSSFYKRRMSSPKLSPTHTRKSGKASAIGVIPHL